MKLEYSDEYGRAFGDLVERKSSVRLFPNDFIDAWFGLIQDIDSGYVGIHPELSLELEHVRAPLDYIIVDDNLNTYAEHQHFQKIIEDLDERYCTLTQIHPRWSDEKEPWWAKRILKYSRQDYANFIYGTNLNTDEIQITIVS